jgi:Rps23 Pro-64 3,4-dihydroxylase Tpa1-like proline 4-hydroxylase
MKLINSKKLSKAPVNKDFFPFFHVENIFLDKIDSDSIIKDFPDIDDGGSFHVDAIPSGESIHRLIEELESEEFKRILETKFNINLDEAKVVTTLRGFSRKKDGKIHTDSKTKILTVLLYLNLNWPENRGNLRLLKGNNNLEEYIKEIPCTFGSLVSFKVTDECWHGFKPYEGKRLSIQLNYIYPEALSSHNLRHKLSSSLKSIFKKKA